ncbi:MAG: hypothetical protein COZ28_01285 [Candidatus Moranbacteria bacterium CG_4_10_14_3_um_filter_44_15]|nr:MAG: hypothetical protein COS72_02840 [Candidatus Moranbacteria bacterium CG06_land_8_20_14_3_00_43_56]PIV84493.1 MAG: hypothetical protein COW51_00230 [Candidatus Moranbacteria bacterium CG17_big_fil_post_rev_8_21_14_2_50_44_12]PIX90901.1 MAG: hypothetical protein COZ28_01285 [Candidatus Moranbacteria bacterium CG_4_10_14_3_um_filter_44_15]PJA85397.1 MAG: hypothetical protein CO142_04035 [Candidatus Moranbacteria bacterium CG_4_9_14_3_um_filter_44_28]
MGIKSSSDIFFIMSVAAVLMAVISWAVESMWLASTQWLLVGIMVGVWGLYLRLRDMHEGSGKKK